MLKELVSEDIPVFSGADINKLLEAAQKSHENYLLKANKKDLDRALVYYLEVIRLNPSIAEVYYKLAGVLWEKGEIDLHSAIKQCKKAVELAPASPTARLYLGYFLKTAGRYDEAGNFFRESIRLDRIKSSKPRLALSLTLIDRLKSIEFNLVNLFMAGYYFLTGVLLSVCDREILSALYRGFSYKYSIFNYKFSANIQKNLRNYKKTVEIYQKAAIETEKKDLFYSKIGDLYKELQNPQRAAEYYRQTLKENPDNVIMWAKLAETLQNYDKQSTEEIIECYNNISRLEPANSKILYELGHLYLKEKNRLCAVSAFKKALELEPQNAFYHNSLAYALVQLQDYDGAIEEYLHAIRINPDNEWTSIVSQALGAIYHQVRDNIDAAIVAYQTSILLDRKNVDAMIALGEAYQDKNDLDKAITCFCNAIKMNGGTARIYSNLGLLLWEKRYIDEAIIAYQKAISLKPEYEIACNNLGVAYLDGKDNPDEALLMFCHALKYNPSYALAYYNKGRAYRVLGNKSEAAKCFQMAIDVNKVTGELDEEEVQESMFGLFSVE